MKYDLRNIAIVGASIKTQDVTEHVHEAGVDNICHIL